MAIYLLELQVSGHILQQFSDNLIPNIHHMVNFVLKPSQILHMMPEDAGINLQQLGTHRHQIPQISFLNLAKFLKPKNIIFIEMKYVLITNIFFRYNIFLQSTTFFFINLIDNQCHIPRNYQEYLPSVLQFEIQTVYYFQLFYQRNCFLYQFPLRQCLLPLLLPLVRYHEILGDILLCLQIFQYWEFEEQGLDEWSISVVVDQLDYLFGYLVAYFDEYAISRADCATIILSFLINKHRLISVNNKISNIQFPCLFVRRKRRNNIRLNQNISTLSFSQNIPNSCFPCLISTLRIILLSNICSFRILHLFLHNFLYLLSPIYIFHFILIITLTTQQNFLKHAITIEQNLKLNLIIFNFLKTIFKCFMICRLKIMYFSIQQYFDGFPFDPCTLDDFTFLIFCQLHKWTDQVYYVYVISSKYLHELRVLFVIWGAFETFQFAQL